MAVRTLLHCHHHWTSSRKKTTDGTWSAEWWKETRQIYDDWHTCCLSNTGRTARREDIHIWYQCVGRASSTVLIREQAEGLSKPIEYCSRSTNYAERLYTTHKRQYLAVIFCLLLLRSSLEDVRLSVVSSHSSLEWLQNFADASEWLSRQRLRP